MNHSLSNHCDCENNFQSIVLRLVDGGVKVTNSRICPSEKGDYFATSCTGSCTLVRKLQLLLRRPRPAEDLAAPLLKTPFGYDLQKKIVRCVPR
jgi:hypothetical protein